MSSENMDSNKRCLDSAEYEAFLTDMGLSAEEREALDPEIVHERVQKLGITFDPKYKLGQ
jgi:hypothetical protein